LYAIFLLGKACDNIIIYVNIRRYACFLNAERANQANKVWALNLIT